MKWEEFGLDKDSDIVGSRRGMWTRVREGER